MKYQYHISVKNEYNLFLTILKYNVHIYIFLH